MSRIAIRVNFQCSFINLFISALSVFFIHSVCREHWYASLAAAAGDETQSTHSVFERLASVSVAARVFGPNGPFSFPHAPVALERLLVYRADGNTVVFTAETDQGFLCFRFYTS
jgi:hypothetical protein